MVHWLETIGLTSTGDYAFLTYLTACVLAVLIVVLFCSTFFGLFNAIFRK